MDKEIREGLKGAIEKGWIKQVGRGKYRLTKKGEAFVESLPRK